MEKPKKKQKERKYDWARCEDCGNDFIRAKKDQKYCDICLIMKGMSRA